jgi:hypothetical protein
MCEGTRISSGILPVCDYKIQRFRVNFSEPLLFDTFLREAILTQCLVCSHM